MQLNAAPIRLQRMLLRLQCYHLDLRYQRGPDRAYLPLSNDNTAIDLNIHMLDYISTTREGYEDIQSRTVKELNLLCTTIINGWPLNRQEVPLELRKYWDARDCLALLDGIVYKGMRIVPPSLVAHMLHLIHSSHMGILKCKSRALEVRYFIGRARQLTLKQLSKIVKGAPPIRTNYPKSH